MQQSVFRSLFCRLEFPNSRTVAVATKVFVGIHVYSISYLVSRVLGTLMTPSPTAVLPRWWSYSGAATLQHHQGVAPWTRRVTDGVADGPMGPGRSALAAISPTLTQHDQAEADVQKQNAMLESEDAIVTRLTEGMGTGRLPLQLHFNGDRCVSFAPSPLMAFTF